MTPPTSTGRCRRCRAPVIDVLTEAGFDLALDPAVLTPLGELRAAVAGHATFTRYTFSGAVHHRPAYKILERPAGTRPRQDVHAVHTCAPHAHPAPPSTPRPPEVQP